MDDISPLLISENKSPEMLNTDYIDPRYINPHALPEEYTIANMRDHYNLMPIEFDISYVLPQYIACPIPSPKYDNHTWGPIIRDYCKIAYITRGCGILTINNIKHHLHAGQIFVNFPGTVITEYTERPDPWGYYCLYIKSSFLPNFLRSIGFSEIIPALVCSDCQKAEKLFVDAIKVHEHSDQNDYIFQQTKCVCNILSMIRENIQYSGIEPTANTNMYIKKALQYFEMHYSRKISIAEVSNALGLDRSHFSRLFKQQMNLSPQEYLIRLRVRKACEFLTIPNATVNSIANSVGYDPFAFSRVFKQIMGCSPTEYRGKMM